MKSFRDLVVICTSLVWLIIGISWLTVILTDDGAPINHVCPAHSHERWALGTNYCELDVH